MISLQDQKKITVTLQQSQKKNVLLSSLLKKKIDFNVEQKVSVEAEFEIIVANNVTAIVVDDLKTTSKLAITFIVQKNASAHLIFNDVDLTLLDNQESILPAAHYRNSESKNNLIKITRSYCVVLQGENATATIKASCLLKNKHISFSLLQKHEAPNTTSTTSVRSVVLDNSQLFCKGLIHINKNGQHSVAELENKNILLSKTAHAVSIPMLEIENNDVVCRHGSAVSKFSKEHFFYLESRGISKDVAEKMLIMSFLS